MPFKSIYPKAIDGFAQIPLVKDGRTKVTEDIPNSLRSAIINIEKTLGIKPSGKSKTVVDRLNNIDKKIRDLSVELEKPAKTVIITSQRKVLRDKILFLEKESWMPHAKKMPLTTVLYGLIGIVDHNTLEDKKKKIVTSGVIKLPLKSIVGKVEVGSPLFIAAKNNSDITSVMASAKIILGKSGDKKRGHAVRSIGHVLEVDVKRKIATVLLDSNLYIYEPK